MKKITIAIALFILATFTAQAQWFNYNKVKGNGNLITKSINVTQYNKIAVAGSFEVQLVKGKESKLEIEIEDNLLEYLITDVVDGKLKIKWEKGVNIRAKKGVKIIATYNVLNAVYLSGSGEIVSSSKIKSDAFYTSVSGSGNINLDIDSNELIAKITGSGDIELAGSTKILEVKVTGSGDFSGYNLNASFVTAKVTGSGDIDVTAKNEISGRITGSGNINYNGNPEIIDTKITGSGSIRSR